MGVGMILATWMHWRTVAQIGAIFSLVGGIVITRAPKTNLYNNTKHQKPTKKMITPVDVEEKDDKDKYHIQEGGEDDDEVDFYCSTVTDSLRRILGKPRFWMLALSYGTTFLAGGLDRILGTFYLQVVPNISPAVCGGLTLSIALGLMHGLVVNSQHFTELQSPQARKRFLSLLYLVAVLATAGLAVVASGDVHAWLPHNGILRTSLIFFFSGAMASTMAFQFYQLPPMIAQSLFGQDKAVCISLLDGCGFLFSAPIFAATSHFIPNYGWASAWIMFALLFGVTGAIMVQSLGPVLQSSATEADFDDLMDYQAYQCGNDISRVDTCTKPDNSSASERPKS